MTAVTRGWWFQLNRSRSRELLTGKGVDHRQHSTAKIFCVAPPNGGGIRRKNLSMMNALPHIKARGINFLIVRSV
jgi:hypothetical protein